MPEIDESAFILGRMSRGEEIPPGKYHIGDHVYIQGAWGEGGVRIATINVVDAQMTLIEAVRDDRG